MKKLFRLTREGVEELQVECDSLIAQRSAIADRIRAARELGDLSENAEYQSAREEQDKLETRISELTHILQNVELIKKPRNNGGVTLGSTVKLKSNDGKTKQLQLVGTDQADPLNGKISDESPIGKALLGKKVGDCVEIKGPGAGKKYEVVAIS
jgi:transcription elongation factor GreA